MYPPFKYIYGTVAIVVLFIFLFYSFTPFKIKESPFLYLLSGLSFSLLNLLQIIIKK